MRSRGGRARTVRHFSVFRSPGAVVGGGGDRPVEAGGRARAPDTPCRRRSRKSMRSSSGRTARCCSRSIAKFACFRTRPLSRLPLPLPDEAAGLKPTSMLYDRDGALWIGTQDRGLIHVSRGRVDRFTKSDGLSGDFVAKIFEDREGNVWVATLEGLNRFRALAVPTISVRQGLSTSSVVSVLADQDGTVWLGTVNGLNRWKDGRIDPVRLGPGRAAGGRRLAAARSPWAAVGVVAARARLARRAAGWSACRACLAATSTRWSRIAGTRCGSAIRIADCSCCATAGSSQPRAAGGTRRPRHPHPGGRSGSRRCLARVLSGRHRLCRGRPDPPVVRRGGRPRSRRGDQPSSRQRRRVVDCRTKRIERARARADNDDHQGRRPAVRTRALGDRRRSARAVALYVVRAGARHAPGAGGVAPRPPASHRPDRLLPIATAWRSARPPAPTARR